jgi:hypothetical protein
MRLDTQGPDESPESPSLPSTFQRHRSAVRPLIESILDDLEGGEVAKA